jgi:hypothetical protein
MAEGYVECMKYLGSVGALRWIKMNRPGLLQKGRQKQIIAFANEVDQKGITTVHQFEMSYGSTELKEREEISIGKSDSKTARETTPEQRAEIEQSYRTRKQRME